MSLFGGGMGLGSILQHIMGRGSGGGFSPGGTGFSSSAQPIGFDLSGLGGGGQQPDFGAPQGRLGFDLSALGNGPQSSPNDDLMRQQRLMSALGSGDSGVAFGAGLGTLLGHLGLRW